MRLSGGVLRSAMIASVSLFGGVIGGGLVSAVFQPWAGSGAGSSAQDGVAVGSGQQPTDYGGAREPHTVRAVGLPADAVESMAPVQPAQEQSVRQQVSTDEARAAWNQWADQTQAFVEDRLLVERPDGEWATASRDSASAAAAAMAGVTIEGVTCGSTVCVLTIAHELAEANQEFFARFRNGEHTGGGALVRRETLPDGRFVTHIYFARPGEELDFRPEA